MTLLLTQIFLYLLAAALIGALAAWFLRRNIARRREGIIQQDWRERVRQIELDRDHAVQKLSTEMAGLRSAAAQDGHSPALADYERLATKLEGQIAEREDAIAELRLEIQSLRDELTDAWSSARQRETALLAQHEQEIANLIAQLEQSGDQASSKRETELRQQHRQEIARLTEQLQQRASRALSERESELGHEHQQEIARLTGQLEQHQSQTLNERETALRQTHQQDISDLSAQFEQTESSASSERENALRREYEQEISALRTELERQRHQASGRDDPRIDDLITEIKSRDDSIAVLRDDLAELNDQAKIDHRGRQDEQLRAAIDESLAWQEKYEAVAAELSDLKSRKTETGRSAAADSRLYTDTMPGASAEKRQRATSDRIGSVLSHPGGPKDRLQEIRGIGPVLERKLNDVGIYHFRQIAEFEAEDITRLSNELGRFGNRITREDWVQQARTLHRKHHG